MENKCNSMCGTIDGAIHCHKNRIIKKLFIMTAMLFMFWIGLQLGELRALDRMMERREHNSGYMMMQQSAQEGWAQQAPVDTTPKATTTTK